MKVPNEVWSGKPNVAATWVEGEDQCFALTGRTDVIRARIDGQFLEVFPERSSQQKALLAALGLVE